MGWQQRHQHQREGKQPQADHDGIHQNNSNTSGTPSSRHPQSQQSEIDFFANNHFSRSFNSLILEDSSDQPKQKKPINKSPPFNVKENLFIDDIIDDSINESSQDAIDYGVDTSISSDDEFGILTEDDINSTDGKDHEPVSTDNEATLTSQNHFSGQALESIAKKPLLKRSSKYFNLSIDSKFSPDQSSPLSVKDTRNEASPSLGRSTPFNKFKRPHKLVSQSPSQSPSNKFKAVLGSISPSKHSKAAKMFKGSTKLRVKSPLRMASSSSTSSPIAKEFSLKRIGGSPNLRFKGSSSPLASHTFDDISVGFDESPSRHRKHNSPTFRIYNDADLDSEKLPSCSNNSNGYSSQINDSLTKNSHDANKENEHLCHSKSTKKSSYRFVKPLQTAFESTGLMKKNSMPKLSKKLPPETPIKRNPLVLLSNDINKSHDLEESFTSQDRSIEVGRDDSTISHVAESNTSYFKIPSSTKPANNSEMMFEGVLDLELDTIPGTPTKSSSRGRQLSLILQESENRPPLKPCCNGSEPCTPVSQLPSDSVVSSQATINLTNIRNKSSVHDRPSNSSFPCKRDAFLTETVSQKDRDDEHLIQKFGKPNIKFLGSGQFSVAFECAFGNDKFAIKRNRKPVMGNHEKRLMLKEIEALRALTAIEEGEVEVEEGKENLVFFVEAWSFNNYYYIMTEYCEGGTLNEFLEEHQNYKIDEFRVWKILIEITSGLRYIHSKNYLHLDLKPANIFITFDGSLKIGDFGLSTKLPVLEEDFDIEGDRNYIAPELINDKIYTPYADIFSAGLIILEIATNIILPGNGSPWRKLRSGDLSDAGKLSSDNISDFLNHKNYSSLTSYNSSLNSLNFQALNSQYLSANGSSISGSRSVPEQSSSSIQMKLAEGDSAQRSKLIHELRDLIPKGAPSFLMNNSHSLDKLVSQMLKPNPFERPSASEILQRQECIEIEDRRKAGATIFEGEFGPNDDE